MLQLELQMCSILLTTLATGHWPQGHKWGLSNDPSEDSEMVMNKNHEQSV